MDEYEVTTDGKGIVGPVNLDQVRRGLAAGKLPADAKVRRIGEEAWHPVLASLDWGPPAEERPIEAHVEPSKKAPTKKAGAPAIAAILFALVAGFGTWGFSILFARYTVQTASMEPTLATGSVVWARASYGLGVHEEDIIVFTEPGHTAGSITFPFKLEPRLADTDVSRVVAIGGPSVRSVHVEDGHVLVDGQPRTEPYVAVQAGGGTNDNRQVPPGSVYVLGDRRGNSRDSRNFGYVPLDAGVQAVVLSSALLPYTALAGIAVLGMLSLASLVTAIRRFLAA